MGRRARHWSVRIAMLLGIALGLWLLGQLRPGELRVAPSPRPVASTPDARPVHTPERWRPTVPALAGPEDDGEDEVADEAVDTGEPPWSEVRIVLEDADGYAVVGWPRIVDCPVAGVRRDAAGEWLATIETGAVCVAWGFRRDGLLMARTDDLEFEAFPDAEVALVFPAERTGGIGIRFQPVDGAIEVVDVLPGTPAWTAGLQSGDRILSVDGIPVDELDPEAFVQTMTGPEGTDVTFELEYEADTGMSVVPVQLTRQFLSG